MAEIDQAIKDELKASSEKISEPEMSDFRLVKRSIGKYEDPGTQLAIRSPMDLNCPQDPHYHTLRATRVQKVPDSASDAAVPESANQLAANTAVIRKWANQRKASTAVPATMPIGSKDQSAWIHFCALELAALVRELPYPVAYLASLTGETLRVFGYSFNSKSHLAVIRQHTTRADERLQELCTGWSTLNDGQSGQI